MPPTEGQASLEALDKIIAERPHKVGCDFSAAAKHLCAFRDELIGQYRAASDEETHGARERLSRVNAVISTVLAGHFPLGPIPWPEIDKARDELRTVVEEAR